MGHCLTKVAARHKYDQNRAGPKITTCCLVVLCIHSCRVTFLYLHLFLVRPSQPSLHCTERLSLHSLHLYLILYSHSMRNSYDSASRPLGVQDHYYKDNNASNPNFEGTGYHNADDIDQYYTASYPNLREEKKSGVSPWIKWGIPIAIIIIAGAVVGAVLAVRAHNKNTQSDISSSPGGQTTAKNGEFIFATGTDTYLLPIYPSEVIPHLLPHIFQNPTHLPPP
jgi:hypothetical protein